MSLPALEDIAAHRLDRDDMTGPIEGVIRIETSHGRRRRRSSWT